MEAEASKKRKTSSVVVSSAEIAAPFRQEVRNITKDFTPTLVGFLANDDAAAKKYAEWTAKACREDGVNFELRQVSRVELQAEIKKANQDDDVHGIMIYYPCFGSVRSFYGGSMDDSLRDLVDVRKDVEGLCYTYRKNLYANVRSFPREDGKTERDECKCVLPCTPVAIVKALEHLGVYSPLDNEVVGNRMTGKVVTVINRSDIVGRPVAAMMANDGATVYSVDVDSIFRITKETRVECPDVSPEDAVRRSDVVVLGVPSKEYSLPMDWIPKDKEVIIVSVSHFRNVDKARLVVERPNVKYVPMIGQVTVAMLERNLCRLAKQFSGENPKFKLKIDAGARVV